MSKDKIYRKCILTFKLIQEMWLIRIFLGVGGSCNGGLCTLDVSISKVVTTALRLFS